MFGCQIFFLPPKRTQKSWRNSQRKTKKNRTCWTITWCFYLKSWKISLSKKQTIHAVNGEFSFPETNSNFAPENGWDWKTIRLPLGAAKSLFFTGGRSCQLVVRRVTEDWSPIRWWHLRWFCSNKFVDDIWWHLMTLLMTFAEDICSSEVEDWTTHNRGFQDSELELRFGAENRTTHPF